MKNTELNNQLKEYAKEDVGYAIESGTHAICGTKNGLIEIESLGSNLFQVWNNKRELLTGIMNQVKVEKWIVNQYVIEA